MDLDKIVKNYQPDQKILDLVKKTKVVLLCGISGAGKNTIQDKLLAKDVKFTRIITSTTRPPRDNNGVMERDGVDYYFFSKDQAAEKITKREYFEVAHVHDNIYGITADEIQRIHDADKVALASIDYQGVEYFHGYHPGIEVIFIVPPSYDVWYQRARQRYDNEVEFQSVLPVRKASALRELDWALNTDYCHFLINDDLDTAVEQAYSMIGGELAEDSLAREAASQMLAAISK
ncbi:hypothetical protein CR956_00295 [Candidatus Saccharibacteria bacterium]|nr:MAG: hypothetical protein CR956_00295 [Candidatus Saccharibacteria bacterium]